MNIRPVVNWKKPEQIPHVEKGETVTFWIAVRYKRKDEWETSIFDAQYVNKPLEYADDDLDNECPLDDDHFCNEDGEAMAAEGWFNLLNHPEFSSFYEPISFSDDYELLGWGDYLKPEFNQ